MFCVCSMFIERKVLQTWPAMVLEDEASVTLNNTTGGLRVPSNMYPLYTRFIRRVELTVEASTIADGSALRLMNNSILKTLCFASATCEDISVEFRQGIIEDKLQMARNMYDLLMKLDNNLPHVQWIHMYMDHDQQFQRLDHYGKIDIFARNMLAQFEACMLSPDGQSATPYPDNMLFTHNLTSISSNWEPDIHERAWLILNNKDSLLKLNVHVRNLDGLQLLFTNKDGSGIIYPHLMHFSLT
ncbi:hypothetical protein LPJ61_006806, partial [Coemansia biformis]